MGQVLNLLAANFIINLAAKHYILMAGSYPQDDSAFPKRIMVELGLSLNVLSFKPA